MAKKCPPGEICLSKMSIILIILILIIVLLILNNKSNKSSNLFNNSNISNTNNNTRRNIINNSRNNNNINSDNNTNDLTDDDIFDLVNNSQNTSQNNDEIIVIKKRGLNQNHNGELIDLNRKPRLENPHQLSYWGYKNNHIAERVLNPQLPPERSFEQTYKVPVNIPTRGYSGGYQQVGMLYKDSVTSEDGLVGNTPESVILPLFGKPVHPGSNKWSYYTSSDKYHTVKIPLVHKGRKCDSQYGCDELYDDDVISVPPYNNEFRVKIYEFDSPRYIPYIY